MLRGKGGAHANGARWGGGRSRGRRGSFCSGASHGAVGGHHPFREQPPLGASTNPSPASNQPPPIAFESAIVFHQGIARRIAPDTNRMEVTGWWRQWREGWQAPRRSRAGPAGGGCDGRYSQVRGATPVRLRALARPTAAPAGQNQGPDVQCCSAGLFGCRCDGEGGAFPLPPPVGAGAALQRHRGISER